MAQAVLRDDGSILAPWGTRDPETGASADGMAVFRPGEPGYAEWLAWIQAASAA